MQKGKKLIPFGEFWFNFSHSSLSSSNAEILEFGKKINYLMKGFFRAFIWMTPISNI